MAKIIKHFYDLDAWQKARHLSVALYKVTRDFPKDERFGMIDQIRRAAVSVASNIAEGFGRYRFKDKLRFYYQSRGSLYEVQSLLIISMDLEYLSKEKYTELFIASNDVARLTWGLIKSIQRQINY
ncbi:four helix bundle protein [Patescibacteria group bacterium]|nr:four helix bundle protein [Patescibacteria group bacterium]MBU4512015.1 four helix bundle protein [Patescibacteria group bacterium]MCG2693208.1 four helix bundle protein [Candidatus Parcubacteria bacterium]